MAAAIRHAARRMIGGHARALEDVPRRLFSAGRCSDAKKLPRSVTVVGEKNLVGQIKRMKEELYSLLSKCQNKNMFHGNLARQNGQLLENLSVQVEPRPNDSRWHGHRVGKMIRDCATYAGVISLTYVVLDKITGPNPRGPNPRGRFVDLTEP